MMELIAGVLVASLLGSAHCAGMCSGFVCLYSAGAPGSDRTGHAAYHVGRLVAYLTVGALAGALGAAAQSAGIVVGLSRGAAIAAGMLMLAHGAHAAWRAARGTAITARGRLAPWMHTALHRVASQPAGVRAATIGLLTGLLPCGWLWAFALTAAAASSPLRGAIVMAAFWAGTVPALLGLGLLLQKASGALRARLPLLTALLVIVMGVLTLLGRVGPHAPPHAHDDAALVGVRP